MYRNPREYYEVNMSKAERETLQKERERAIFEYNKKMEEKEQEYKQLPIGIKCECGKMVKSWKHYKSSHHLFYKIGQK